MSTLLTFNEAFKTLLNTLLMSDYMCLKKCLYSDNYCNLYLRIKKRFFAVSISLRSNDETAGTKQVAPRISTIISSMKSRSLVKRGAPQHDLFNSVSILNKALLYSSN